MKTTLIRISVWTFALSLVPGMTLAAKGSDPMGLPHGHIEAPHPNTVVNPALIGPAPSMMINKAPATTRAQPKVKINQVKPSSVSLPSGVRANSGKLASPKKLNPAATPGRIVKLPGTAGLKNAAALRNLNQARGLNDAKGAAETASNVSNMPKGLGGGMNPDLGLGGGSQAKGLDGKPMDLSKLPGHGAGGFERHEGTEYLPNLPNNQDKGPSNAGLKPSGNLRDVMGGAAQDDGVVSWLRTQYNRAIGREAPPVERLPLADRPDENQFSDTEPATSVRYADRQVTTIFHRNRDGSYTRQDNTLFNDGSTNVSYAQYGANGERETADVVIKQPPPGSDGGLDEQPGTEGGSGNAAFNRWAAQFDHSAKAGPPIITQVNPSRAEDGGNATTLVIPEDQLVINPSPEAGNGQALDSSPEARKTRQEQMLEAVNGPSDGGIPEPEP